MRVPRSPLARAAAVAALVVLQACGGPRLAPDSPPGAELQGTWRLDAGASDDAAAIIAAALPKIRTRAPAAEPHGGPAAEPRPGRTAGQAAGPGAMARDYALPALTLRIGGTPREIVIDQDGRQRRLVPGDETPYSVTDRYGTRSIRAGWDLGEFVVVGTAAGFELTERFRRGAAPDTLVTDVTLQARGLGAIRIASLYRRAPDGMTRTPADEGPPAPRR